MKKSQNLHKGKSASDSGYVAVLHRNIVDSLENSKALEIVTIDMIGKSALADKMIIASGRSQRHVGAIVDHLSRDLKKAGFGAFKTQGLPHCDWVIMDMGDVLAHIFCPEVREFYNLEKMWSQDTDALSS